MSWLCTAIITGIISFAATNIDDIVILTLFYAQMNATFRKRHIVAGQYRLHSTPDCQPAWFFCGLIVPQIWTGILGLVPLPGISHLVNQEKDGDQVQAVSDG